MPRFRHRSAANPKYGAQIWLNTDRRTWPSLPADTFAFQGFQEQKVVMVPAADLVVVRLGYTFDETAHEVEPLVGDVIKAL